MPRTMRLSIGLSKSFGRRRQQLDGHAPFEDRIVARRFVDHAHAAAANLADQAIRPETASLDRQCLPRLDGPHGGGRVEWHLQEARILLVGPAPAMEIIEFAGRVAAESARIYAEEIGCDIVALVEPVGSQVRPEAYDKFVIPYCQPALEAIRKAGKTTSLYICGDATKIVENMMYTGASAVCVDEQLNMNYVRDCALKYGRGFGGNLKLTLALSLGILDPREDAIVSLAAGGKIGYTFSPG